VQTRPKENPDPAKLSALRFPDWVENKIREEKRQGAAIDQFYKIEDDEIEAFGHSLENGEENEDEEGINEDDAEFVSDALDRELDNLMEMNVDIEV
jgi:hypothetical protein